MRRFPAISLLALAALGCLAEGCAAALHAPPPLSSLGGGGPVPSPEKVSELLSRADVLYAARTLESVREAGRMRLQAARAEISRTQALQGAAQAEIWLVEHEPDGKAREAAALLAVQAAQWCLLAAPESAGCNYYLGAALGVQAREKPSTALDALPRIERAFLKASAEDPALDEAGPDRALALLYLRAPGWPTGPGDPERGLECARKAVERKPGYPPNLLALAEALEAGGERKNAREYYSKALELARNADLARDPDAAEWIREAQSALDRGSSGP